MKTLLHLTNFIFKVKMQAVGLSVVGIFQIQQSHGEYPKGTIHRFGREKSKVSRFLIQS